MGLFDLYEFDSDFEDENPLEAYGLDLSSHAPANYTPPVEPGGGEYAPPPPPPSPDIPEVLAAMDTAAKKEATGARSRAATILTSGRGLLKGPSVARRMLLGA